MRVKVLLQHNRLVRLWYLIYTKVHKEQVAYENLLRQGFEVFLPKMSKKIPGGKQKTEPMFPRYLFINLSIHSDNWAPIRSTLGVANLVRFGLEPACVKPDLMDTLIARCGISGILELPSTEFKIGDCVRVANGVFSGYEAIITSTSGQERVELLFSHLQSQLRVNVPVECLELVGS